MKQNKALRRILCVFAVLSLMAGSALAAGNAVKSQMMEVFFSDMKVIVDGAEVAITDSNGKPVTPYLINGTTYLPMRSLANLLGKDVYWEGETNTTYIGKRPDGEINWMKELPPYQLGLNTHALDGTNGKEKFSVSGVPHTIGVQLYSNGGDGGSYAIWNTNGMYKTMTFTIGSIDGNQHDITLDVSLNGEYSTSYELKWDSPAQTITIPLNYAGNIKLEGGNFVNYGIYDISFSE